MIGPNLKALICGSAPLSVETQLYFMMLGIPVLQVYGLTETTGICTLDDPRHVEPGRVGPAIEGIEMKLAENDEIIARLPAAQQVVLVGNGRSYLSAIVTGNIVADQVQAALDAVNAGLPHYKQVRTFRIVPEAFTIENGLLTANGKL